MNIWDDHEYTDDCWGGLPPTTTAGATRTTAPTGQRRDGVLRIRRRGRRCPGRGRGGPVEPRAVPDARLYRELRYGRNLHLLLTDYRSFRPDHLIAEDAFPGTVAVDPAALTALLAAQGTDYDSVKANFAPYIDLDAPPAVEGLLRSLPADAHRRADRGLHEGGAGAGEADSQGAGKIPGKLDAHVVNALLARYNAAHDQPRGAADGRGCAGTLDRGISYPTTGKIALISSLGARYFVVKPTYDLYAAYRTLLLGTAAAENAYGDAQRVWLESTLRDRRALEGGDQLDFADQHGARPHRHHAGTAAGDQGRAGSAAAATA